MYRGGEAAMDITLSFYTQDIRVLGIRTPPPTSLGLATPLPRTALYLVQKPEIFQRISCIFSEVSSTYVILRLLNAVIQTSIFCVISRNLKMRTRKVVKKACFN